MRAVSLSYEQYVSKYIEEVYKRWLIRSKYFVI